MAKHWEGCFAVIILGDGTRFAAAGLSPHELNPCRALEVGGCVYMNTWSLLLTRIKNGSMTNHYFG